MSHVKLWTLIKTEITTERLEFILWLNYFIYHWVIENFRGSLQLPSIWVEYIESVFFTQKQEQKVHIHCVILKSGNTQPIQRKTNITNIWNFFKPYQNLDWQATLWFKLSKTAKIILLVWCCTSSWNILSFEDCMLRFVSHCDKRNERKIYLSWYLCFYQRIKSNVSWFWCISSNKVIMYYMKPI